MTNRIAILLLLPSLLPGASDPCSEPAQPPPAAESGAPDWDNLVKESAFFAAIQHGFRLATESGTRENLKGPFLRGWGEAVKSIHGWSDGDPFIVNYVGHPMQGATSGFVWIQNDRAFRRFTFSRDSRYWKSRLRAAAFAAAYSEQFELGPVSEATIGKVQRDYPQRGFVDHVVTPSIGLGWIIAEDAVDRYVIEALERRIHSRWPRVFLRAGLNPSRSMANLVAGRVPWYRTYRPGALVRDNSVDRSLIASFPPAEPPPGVAPFEIAFTAHPESFPDGIRCAGGGVSPAFRLSYSWQFIADIGGCKLLDRPAGQSGDSLHYRIGPRWSPRPDGLLSPHVQVLIGGAKVSVDRSGPEKERLLAAIKQGERTPKELRDAILRADAANGLSLAAGAGVDFNLSPALAVRLLALEYRRNWLPPIAGAQYTGGLRFSSGVLLKMGTW